MEKLYDRLFPEDHPQSVKRWRMTVSQLLFVITVFCIFTGAAMTAGVPGVGAIVWDQGVRNRVEETAKPIKDELAAVKAEQGEQRKLLQRVANSIDAQLAQSKAAQIRLLALKRCQAAPNSDEREALFRELEQAQDEYRAIRGNSYVPPLCSEL